MTVSDEKLLNDFYRHDDRGNRLFCLWASGGDSFIIDATQALQIDRVLKVFLLTSIYTIAAVFLYCELNTETRAFRYNWVVSLGISVSMLIYFLYIRFLVNKLGLKPSFSAFQHRKLHIKLFKLTSVQVVIIVLGLLYHPYDFMLWSSALAVICLNSFLIVLAWYKEAYFIRS